MSDTRTVDELLAEAAARPLVGWDFSWLGDRLAVEPLPWDFDAIVDSATRRSPDLLDLGTGGGEWLASLPHRPPRTVATESWPPNVPVAERRLGPLEVEVVQVEPARDNTEQAPGEADGGLPFADGSFHLVVSRHESYVAAEIARVLGPGGRFLTQQLAPGTDDFARLLGLPAPDAPLFDLELALRQVEDTGLDPVDSAEAVQTLTFGDVGALAWYLRAIPWTVPDFDLETSHDRLRRLHDSSEPLRARLYAFRLEAISR